MSNKLIKKGQNTLVLPGDNVVVGQIQIMQSGRINVQAPTIHPLILIKILNNLGVSLIDSMLEQEQNLAKDSGLVNENGDNIVHDDEDKQYTGPIGSV